jgi:hypothetical protein
MEHPTTYAFQQCIDDHKHLDTDEFRHMIKPIIHIIDQDFKGQEHKFCDKSQLCPLGTFRRPKIMIEAESRGFASVSDMIAADKKAKEESDVNKIEQQQKQIDELKEMVMALMANKSTTN